MIYYHRYTTPDGFDDMMMSSDGETLIGLGFIRPESNEKLIQHNCANTNLPIFDETIRWLDIYFSGQNPNFTPHYRIENASPFREMVLQIVSNIPFGQTVSYGSIAAEIARCRGIAKMSAQAVGNAVGWNPICLIIPCHRVIGSSGRLVGYGGGMENKERLLRLESRRN